MNGALAVDKLISSPRSMTPQAIVSLRCGSDQALEFSAVTQGDALSSEDRGASTRFTDRVERIARVGARDDARFSVSAWRTLASA
jgi:hypothetical protein